MKKKTLFVFIVCIIILLVPDISFASTQQETLISIARTEVGNTNGSKYGSSSNWCALFVGWCAAQSGLTNIIPSGIASANTFYQKLTESYGGIGVYFSDVSALSSYASSYLKYSTSMKRSSYKPQPGDIIFYRWNRTSGTHTANTPFSHVGIVYAVDSSYVYTVHGNYSDKVNGQKIDGTVVGNYRRALNDAEIAGYVRPNYTDTEAPTAILSVDRKKYNPNDTVTFTFGGNNSGTYTLGIYKDFDRIDTVTVVGNTYTRTFPVGCYSAYMTAYNEIGFADSNWVDWQVNDLTADLSVNSDGFLPGDTVTFTFGGNNSLTYSNGPCTFSIFKDGIHYDTVTVYDEIYVRIFNEPGEYSAYMTAYSESEYKDSNWVYWKVKEWPSAPILKCPDMLYDVNNDLTFEWNECQKTDYYDFWVYQGDTAVHTTCYIDGLSHKLRLPEGTYRAKVASVNKKYSTWTWSNEYEFTVVDRYPERPILEINNSNISAGGDIYFSWNDCKNTDDYDFYIYDADGKAIITSFYYDELSKLVTLPSGNYIARVASVNRNNGTWLWSNDISFTVNETYYDIIYDTNGGNETIPMQTKIYGNDIILCSSVPTRNGYRFLCWNTKSDGTGDSYQAGSEYTKNESITLYAQWISTIPYTESTIIRQDSIHTIMTNVYNITEQCQIIIAGYKNNELAELEIQDYSKDAESFTIQGDFDTFNVMIWESGTMKPLCNAEIIPESKWITK